MSGFSADWLALREPADEAARAPELVERLHRLGPRRGKWRIVDLGCGTGANLRYLSPRLGGTQDWLLVDDDAALLERASAAARRCSAGRAASAPPAQAAAARAGAEAVSVRCARLDLAASLDAVPWPAHGLVTASALLDLVSAEWLDALCGRARAAAADVLFVLTYDGRMDFTPEEPDDAWVRGLVNAHQRGDKGFGPALGPGAAAAAARLFEAAGYRVETLRSDWRLDDRQRDLQRALLDGWRDAAAEMAPGEAARLARWHLQRTRHVAAGVSRLVVGHVDLLGRLPEKGGEAAA